MKFNYMKKLILLVLVCVLGTSVYAQQDPEYSYFFRNKLAYNPAVAGEMNAICITGLFRRQWNGYKDEGAYINNRPGTVSGVGPATQTLSITSPIKRKGMPFIGAGLQIIDDALGYENTTTIKFSASKTFVLKNGLNGFLSAGLDMGITQKGLDGSHFNPLQPGDPLVPTGKVDDGNPDFGAGVYYYHPGFNNDLKNFYFGASMTHLNEANYTYSWGANNSNQVQVQQKRHMYFTSGVDYDLHNGFVLKPALMLKSNARTQVDVNVSAEYLNKFSGGLGYRTLPNSDALIILLGMKPQTGLNVGYAYDLTLSNLRSYQNGTHELVAKYCFIVVSQPPPLAKPIENPRWLGGGNF